MDNIIKYEGEIKLGNIRIQCMVLEDKTRVLSELGIQNILRMFDDPCFQEEIVVSYTGKDPQGEIRIKPKSKAPEKYFVDFEPITCYKDNQKVIGYEATKFVDMCMNILYPKNILPLKDLSSREIMFIKRLDIFMNGLYRVGIIPLIDEATGYQEVRDSFELRNLFNKYLSEKIIESHQTKSYIK